MQAAALRGLPAEVEGGVNATEYHAIKALSAGMIWTMDSECPLKAWLASPWNPDREAENAVHFDIGRAAHLAVLEPHLIADQVVVHEHAEYRSNAAKAVRDEAYAAGKTPLKPDEWAIVEGVQNAISGHPTAIKLFGKGEPEVTLTWEWDGLPCKARPDFLADDLTYVLDLKTANTINPRAVGRKAFGEGWFVRAAWYTAGVKAARGTLPDKYLFVVVEKDAPHLIGVYELDNRALLFGEQIIMRTLDRAVTCLKTGIWPGYGDGEITRLSLPTWAEYQLAEAETEQE